MVNVLIVGASEDQEMTNKMQISLRRIYDNQVKFYDFHANVTAGSETEREQRRMLHEADVVLYGISPDSMNSDYLYGIPQSAEWQIKQQEGRTLPVLLRPTSGYQNLPGLAGAVPSAPISQYTDQDVTFTQLGRVVEQRISQLPSRIQSAQIPLQGQIVLSAQEAGRLRQQLDEIYRDQQAIQIRQQEVNRKEASLQSVYEERDQAVRELGNANRTITGLQGQLETEMNRNKQLTEYIRTLEARQLTSSQGQVAPQKQTASTPLPTTATSLRTLIQDPTQRRSVLQGTCNPDKIQIHVVGSQADQENIAKLIKHLTPLIRAGKIEITSGVNVSGMGNKLDILPPETESERVKNADLLLVFNSPELSADDHAYEMAKLAGQVRKIRKKESTEQGTSYTVLPILGRPTDQMILGFEQLRAAPYDVRGAISQWDNADEALILVTSGVREVVTDLEERNIGRGGAGGQITDIHHRVDNFLKDNPLGLATDISPENMTTDAQKVGIKPVGPKLPPRSL